jgi:chromosome segregation ATPase
MSGNGIIEKAKSFFSSDDRELKVRLEEAAEKFREERISEIDSDREEAEELMEQTEEILERVKDDLEEIKDYEDNDDIEAVEDVAENFYQSRKRLIEGFELPKDIREHWEEFEDFLEDFNDVSRKEGAVMKRVQKGSGRLSDSIVELMDHKERLEEFVEEDYRSVRQLETIEEMQQNIQELEEELEELREEFESVDADEMDDRIEELEENIEEFQQSEEWQKKENLEEELELLEEKRDEREAELRRKISKLERGLKKLIYSIENDGQEFEGDFVTLKAFFNDNYRKVDSPFPELEEASEILEEEDMLDERQLEKFQEAVQDLKNFQSDVEEIEEFEEDIEKVEEKLDEIDLEDKRKRLEKERKSVQEKLENKQQRMEDLRDRIEEKEWEIENSRKELEKMMNQYLEPEIKLEDDGDSKEMEDEADSEPEETEEESE